MMVQAYPSHVHTNEFLAKYLYSFRNRLSEARLNDGINYDKYLASKKHYKFSTHADFEKAKELIGYEEPKKLSPAKKDAKQTQLI